MQASDRNGDMVRFSANANMGPGANPFIGDNPAQFDETQGIFSWTPSAAQAGEYHVTFIATDESAAQLSSEESIAIRVTSLGEKLFLSHCSECHGEDAQGSNTVPAILFKTALDINNAIDSVDRMNYLRDELSQPDIEEIASFLDLNANI